MVDGVQLRKAAMLLPGEVKLRNVFTAVRGPRPGAEVFGLPIVMIVVLAIPGSPLMAAVTGALIGGAYAVAIRGLRAFVTIAISDEAIFVLRNEWLRPSTPRVLERVLTQDEGFTFREGGDRSLYVGATRYWVAGSDSDAALRAAKQWKSLS